MGLLERARRFRNKDAAKEASVGEDLPDAGIPVAHDETSNDDLYTFDEIEMDDSSFGGSVHGDASPEQDDDLFISGDEPHDLASPENDDSFDTILDIDELTPVNEDGSMSGGASLPSAVKQSTPTDDLFDDLAEEVDSISGDDYVLIEGSSPMTDMSSLDEGAFAGAPRHADGETICKDISESDIPILFQIIKDMMKSSSVDDLYDTILFSLIGQIPTTGSSIIVPAPGEPDKWMLKEIRGLRLKSRKITFKNNETIFSDILKKKDILKVADYSRIPSARDEYQRLLSIEAHILFPVIYEEKVVFIIGLGSKLNKKAMFDPDIDFVRTIADFASSAYGKVLKIDKLTGENDSLLGIEKRLQDYDSYDLVIRKSRSAADIESIVQKEMENQSVDSYAFFIRDEYTDCFKPVFVEKNDHMRFKERGFTISADNAFTAHLLQLEGYEIFDNPPNSDLLKKVFTEDILTKINTFTIYPFHITGRLIGFVILFRVNLDLIGSNIVQIVRFTKTLFSNIINKESIRTQSAPYVDNLGFVYKRIQDQLDQAGAMKIPVAFSVFTIKNFKRFSVLEGEGAARELIDIIRKKIESKLSETDFAVRLDRGKVLIILPGKNKKHAITLSNAIRNEVSDEFSKTQSQLLLTFLTAEYPEDGKSFQEIFSQMD